MTDRNEALPDTVNALVDSSRELIAKLDALMAGLGVDKNAAEEGAASHAQDQLEPIE